jgi:hypothetical protein
MTLTTPGKTACPSAAAKIQPRTNRETLLPTLSFPLVEKLQQSNPVLIEPQTCPHSNGHLVCSSILTHEYAGWSTPADYLSQTTDDSFK